MCFIMTLNAFMKSKLDPNSLAEKIKSLQGLDPDITSSLLSAIAEKATTIQSPYSAKHEPLTSETSLKQPQNNRETNPKHSTSSPQSNPAETINLDELSLDLQSRLLDILDSTTLDEATTKITVTKPYGLGIRTNRSALYRFHKRHKSAELTARRDDAARNVAEILKNAEATEADFSRATAHLIKLRLLEATMTERPNPNTILSLTSSLDRFRAADHAERRLRLAEEKAERQTQTPPSPTQPK
jgi:hypothetical protein